MAFWNSRTQMEHAKTRAIHLNDKSKANGKDNSEEELDEYEQIEKLREENAKQLSEIKLLTAKLHEMESEIKRLRTNLDKNTDFMHQIILELINKPTPKSAAQTYLESKISNSGIPGPKGKLP
jgi:uncharacterized protein involved in exopolysaccharide biosynthesis